jgi:hypothetical protein
VVVGAGWLLRHSSAAPTRRRTVIVLGGLGVLTWRQTQIWAQTATLWTYCRAATPMGHSHRPLSSLLDAGELKASHVPCD